MIQSIELPFVMMENLVTVKKSRGFILERSGRQLVTFNQITRQMKATQFLLAKTKFQWVENPFFSSLSDSEWTSVCGLTIELKLLNADTEGY